MLSESNEDYWPLNKEIARRKIAAEHVSESGVRGQKDRHPRQLRE